MGLELSPQSLQRERDDAVIRPGEDRESGITLTELLVTMMIMSFIVIATAALVIGTQRTSQQNVNRLDQIQEARNGTERMSQTLRTAVMPSQLLGACLGCTDDAFVQGRKFEVQFYGNFENSGNLVGPSRITYVVSDPDADGIGELIQSIQIPDSPNPTATGYQYCDPPAPACSSRVRTSVVARDVVIDSGTPLIRYFDAVGDEMHPGSGSLTGNQLSKVLSVELFLRVQGQQGDAQAKETSFVQRIMLPNAQAVIRQGKEEEDPP